MIQLDGCIETMLVKDFKVKYWHAHVRRLRKSVAAICNQKINADKLETDLVNYMNNVSWKDYIIRIQYNACHELFQISHRELGEFPSRPQVAIFRSVKLPIHPLSWIKRSNRTLFNEAQGSLKDLKLDDVILLNEDGFVCESTIANVFIKTDQTYVTPSLDQGCVDGVLRSKMLSEFKRKGHKCEQRPIKPEELYSAKKVFLSNAVRGFYQVDLKV